MEGEGIPGKGKMLEHTWRYEKAYIFREPQLKSSGMSQEFPGARGPLRGALTLGHEPELSEV